MQALTTKNLHFFQPRQQISNNNELASLNNNNNSNYLEAKDLAIMKIRLTVSNMISLHYLATIDSCHGGNVILEEEVVLSRL